jgi:hypothetical protein
MTPTLWRVGIVNASTKSAEPAGWRLHRHEGRELPRQKGVIQMNNLLVARPGERPAFQLTPDACSFISILIICALGILVSLCAASYGLDLSASPP